MKKWLVLLSLVLLIPSLVFAGEYRGRNYALEETIVTRIPGKHIVVETLTGAAISAAITELGATGGTVELIEGTYTCTSTITISSRSDVNLRITGAGAGTILNFTQTDSSDCISLVGPASGGDWTNKADGLIIENLQITCTTSTGDAIYIENANWPTLQNIWISSCGGYGVNLDTITTGKLANVNVYNAASGGFYWNDCHQTSMMYCEATECEGPGATLRVCYEAMLLQNSFEYNDDANLYIYGSPNIVISYSPGLIVGNDFTSSGGSTNNYGIKILDAYNWIITNNHISMNPLAGIYAKDSHALEFCNNIIKENHTYPIVLENSSWNKISNNIMAINWTSDVIQEDENCYYNNIKDNGPMNDNIISIDDGVSIDNCNTLWTGKTNVTTTRTYDSTGLMEGTYALQNVIASAFTTGLIATHDFSSLDISAYDKVGFWIRSNSNVSANVLQLVLDDTSACASPVETLNIPALTANDWKYVELTLSNPDNCTALISVGFNAAIDPGAITFFADNIATEYSKVWLDRSANRLYIQENIIPNMPYKTEAPSSPVNGDFWMESSGIHIYCGGAERVVTNE